MTELLSKYDPILKRLPGQICWGVEWERMRNLSMSFGEPFLKIMHEPRESKSESALVRQLARRRAVVVRGRWWLWVNLAYWRILHSSTCLVSSSSPLRKKQAAFVHLDGQKLTRIHISKNTYTTRLEFDLGSVLEIRRRDKQSQDELWLLYESDGQTLSLRGNGILERELASETESHKEVITKIEDDFILQ